MLKYLLLIALALVVWWGWKKRRTAADAAAAPPPARSPEAMVRCAHCGVYLPASDAVADGERHYCNPAHRDAARRRG
jgi:uncharacterized protein